jgi:hypothetical protein
MEATIFSHKARSTPSQLLSSLLPGDHQLVVRDTEGRYQSAGPDAILHAAKRCLKARYAAPMPWIKSDL